jgi:hypothetical protein
MWGYTPIPAPELPDAEKPTLQKWAKEQDDKPWLRYTAKRQWRDPAETGAVSVPTVATALGVRTCSVTKMLMSATPYKEASTKKLAGSPRVLTVGTEMTHVTGIIGGFNRGKRSGRRAHR